MPKIKLLAPINHDGENLEVGTEIVVTEKQAARLIDFNVAELIDAKVNPTPSKTEPADPIASMTKKDCIAELTAAGIEADGKLKAPELQNMVRELRLKQAGGLPENDDDELNPAEMDREELESALTARAIDFDSEDTDEDLRELLIEAIESDNE